MLKKKKKKNEICADFPLQVSAISGRFLAFYLSWTCRQQLRKWRALLIVHPSLVVPVHSLLWKPHIDSLFTRFQCFVQSFSVVVGICTSSMHTNYYCGGHSAVCLEMVGLCSKCLLWTCLSVGQWWITLDCNKTCTYIFAVVDCWNKIKFIYFFKEEGSFAVPPLPPPPTVSWLKPMLGVLSFWENVFNILLLFVTFFPSFSVLCHQNWIHSQCVWSVILSVSVRLGFTWLLVLFSPCLLSVAATFVLLTLI